MTHNPFRLMRALLGVCSRGARAASRFAPRSLAWLAPLLWGPACALALDIGEIQVNSALNQLFDARIPLPTLVPEELSKISVKLAPAPIFKEFNLERAPVLTSLVFSVEYNAEGEVYVKVVSTKPIQEPSLGLLVEFGWPRGKTFREFTVFLDPVRRLAQRPGDRSKTVLNVPALPAQPAPPPVVAAPPQPAPPPVVAAPPPQPAPPPVAAAPEPNPEPDAPAGDSANPEAVATVAAKAVDALAETPFPVEASSPPVRIYRPGDTYGPVAPSEGLWDIALKVRPDPGITRNQMMQALFETNPHAFGKAGVSGLMTGAMLRLPSFREIADITGSATARQLAGVEQQPAAAATPPSPASATPQSPASKAIANSLEVFPLEPPAPLEPTVVMGSPSALPTESARLVSAAASVAPASEPAAAGPEPKTAAFVAPPVTALTEPDQEFVLEPVSVTPLLFLAVSEMIAALAQPPAMTTVSQVEAVTLEPKQEASATPESSAVVSEVETPTPASTAAPESPVASMNTALLAAVEKHSPPLEQQDRLLQMVSTSDFAVPILATITESLPTPVVPAGMVAAASSAASAELPGPTVSGSPRQLAADPAEPSAKAAEPFLKPYKGSDQYGPVAPKERLWDIAAKVRPDPGISKEHMMKSLLKANPQAFSKPNNMDSLKVGTTLRIPTLQEIVEYTGSKAARQLLEQQEAAAMSSAPTPEPAAPAAPVAETPPPALEPAAPAAETPPAPEPAAPAAETPPVSEPTMPEPVTLPASEPLAPEPAAPAVETLPVSEPTTPEPVTLPASEPLAPEPAAPAAETPLAPEPIPSAQPVAETSSPSPVSEPATPPTLEPTAPAAEMPPTGETSSAN